MKVIACSRTRRSRCTASPTAGIALIDCLVYISLLFILLGLAFAAFYRTLEQSTHLNNNTSDLVRALWAGERWREDVRRATAPPRFAEKDNQQTLLLQVNQQEIAYRFTSNAVVREEARGVREELVTGVKTSAFHRDGRKHVTAWRWELALKSQQRVVRVLPLLSFQAVATQTSPP